MLDDRKQELVTTATEVFLKYGYKKTTLDDVADAVGMQKSSLYHYFKNKDDLFRATVENIHTCISASIKKALFGGGTFCDDMAEFVRVLQYHLKKLHPSMITMLSEIRSVAPIIQDLNSVRVDDIITMLDNRIEQAYNDGELVSRPPKDLAVILVTFVTKVLLGQGLSKHHMMVAKDLFHYVLVLFEPYFTTSQTAEQQS